MSGFQLATVILGILGFLLTAGNIVLGYIVSAVRGRLAKIETQNETIAHEVQKLREKVLEEYVKAPQLQAVLQQINDTLAKLGSSVEATREEIHKLNTTVAVLERATLQGKQQA